VFDSIAGDPADGSEINIAHNSAGQTLTFNITNNQMRQSVGGKLNAINIVLGSSGNGSTLLQGKITGNAIGNNAVANSGSANGNGIKLDARTGTVTALLSGNTVRQVQNDHAVWLEAGVEVSGVPNPTMNVTVNGNNDFQVNTASTNALAGLGINVGKGAITPDSPTACFNIAGNTAFVGQPTFAGLYLAMIGTSPTVSLVNLGGTTTDAAVATYLSSTARATTNTPAAIFSRSVGTVNNVTSCPTPP
jgi:hypothetical protein